MNNNKKSISHIITRNLNGDDDVKFTNYIPSVPKKKTSNINREKFVFFSTPTPPQKNTVPILNEFYDLEKSYYELAEYCISINIDTLDEAKEYLLSICDNLKYDKYFFQYFNSLFNLAYIKNKINKN